MSLALRGAPRQKERGSFPDWKRKGPREESAFKTQQEDTAAAREKTKGRGGPWFIEGEGGEKK